MSELRMGTAEARFADIIWKNEPISSGELSKFANKEFEWKKTTSFTVLALKYGKNRCTSFKVSST